MFSIIKTNKDIGSAILRSLVHECGMICLWMCENHHLSKHFRKRLKTYLFKCHFFCESWATRALSGMYMPYTLSIRTVYYYIIIKNVYQKSKKNWNNWNHDLWNTLLYTEQKTNKIAVILWSPFNPLSPHDASTHHFASLKNDLRVQNEIFSWKCFNNDNTFFNLPPISHLHSLQVENCDSNSRLVVDEDDNVNSGLK